MTASSDVKFILNLQNNAKNPEKPKDRDKEKKKKPEGMNRELFNLLGGVQPDATGSGPKQQPEESLLKEIRPGVTQNNKWLIAPFTNPARKDGLVLYHWQKESEINEPYPYAKLNKKVEVIKYNEEEYNNLIAKVDSNWTKEDTDFLFDLCERFDLRFIIVTDRFNISRPNNKRSIEEIKARYYSIGKILLENRGDINHPIVKHPYNLEYEIRRKANMEKMFVRTQDSEKLEKQLLDNIKMLDNRIKKEEKELKSLKKLQKIQEKKLSMPENSSNIILKLPIQPALPDTSLKIPENPSILPENMPSAEKMEDVKNEKTEQVLKSITSKEICENEKIENEDEKSMKSKENDENSDSENEKKLRGGRKDRGSGVYLRSEMFKTPLPMPEKTKKKLAQILKELNVPENLMPTLEIIKAYDNLRVEIIGLLNLEKIIKQKEKEIANLKSKLEPVPTAPQNMPSGEPQKPDEKISENSNELPNDNKENIEKKKDNQTIAGRLNRERKQIVPLNKLDKKNKTEKTLKPKKEKKSDNEIPKISEENKENSENKIENENQEKIEKTEQKEEKKEEISKNIEENKEILKINEILQPEKPIEIIQETKIESNKVEVLAELDFLKAKVKINSKTKEVLIIIKKHRDNSIEKLAENNSEDLEQKTKKKRGRPKKIEKQAKKFLKENEEAEPVLIEKKPE